MIPIGDNDGRVRRVPIMTWVLIAVNAVVFLYELTLSAPGLDRFILTWGAVPSAITAAFAHPGTGNSLHAFLTLITSQFIHGGWLHILGNMLFLWIFGDDIEDVLGSPLYVLFYLFCGIVAGLAQSFVLSSMLGAESVPGIGASGAIAGVLGAYLVLFPTRPVRVLAPFGSLSVPLTVPAFVMLGLWFLEQFFSGVLSLTPSSGQSSGIGFWAHIGGFVAGFILILPFVGRARGIDNGMNRIQRGI